MYRALFVLVAVSLVISTAVLAERAATPSSSTAPGTKPANTPDNCARCHAKLEDRRGEAVRRVVGDVHGKAGVGCVDCHGGDPAADKATEAHGKDFVAQAPDAKAAVAMCGKCHAKPAEGYQKSPHFLGKSTQRHANCTTCHGTHGIQPAGIDLIGEPLCTSCHTIDQARRIWKALNGAETKIAELENELAALGDGQDLRDPLRTARADLRGHSHALDMFAITREADKAMSVVDEVRAKARPRLASRSFGRKFRTGLAAIGGTLLLAGLLWLAFRRGRQVAQKFPVPRGRKLVVASVVGGVLLLAAGATAWRGQHYIQHDPRFCTSCHVMDTAFSAWGQSAHKNIECHTCHAPDLAANLHQLWFYVTEKPISVVRHAYVDHQVCAGCHAGGTNASKWNQIVETAGHRVHVTKKHVECVQCHAPGVHRFKPTTELCQTCHSKVTLTAAGKMAEMHCLECHPFLAEGAKRGLKPDRVACLECHSKKPVKGEVFPENAPMKWACGECHKPHAKLKIKAEDCAECHADEIGGPIHQIPTHNDCIDCHRPHSWSVTANETCAACHSMPEHNPGKRCIECHNNKEAKDKAKPAKGAPKK